jgi:hypothetical protein
VQVLTEIPAGVESGWHMHPARRSDTSSPEPSRCESGANPR